jgi:hypothetical protein
MGAPRLSMEAPAFRRVVFFYLRRSVLLRFYEHCLPSVVQRLRCGRACSRAACVHSRLMLPPLFSSHMMKRVMSAPVGASRAPQQQQQLASASASASTSSSANHIGTAAFFPRSSNVALDPVPPPPPHVAACAHRICTPRLASTDAAVQFQSGVRGGNLGSIYGKTPGSAQGVRDRSGMGGGAGAGRGR